jgi:phosphate transport system substrate-binding protein
MNGRRLAVLLLAALALLVAGCGGDDESEASDETAIVETTNDDGTETADDDGTETEDDTTEDGAAALEGECAEFAGLSAKLSQALSGSSSDLDSASEVFDELADQVPDEIQDDYEVLADNFRELAEALEGVDLSGGSAPSQEDLAKIQELTQSLDTPEVREAAQNIEAWATENC